MRFMYRNLLIIVAVLSCLGLSACGGDAIPLTGTTFALVENQGDIDSRDVIDACGSKANVKYVRTMDEFDDDNDLGAEAVVQCWKAPR